ncbi:MAG TPA: hypothetical protein VG962_10030 [Steroidobacteraceae bacterium]|nr:hypothetical protein [Steroidobacteraceae bacterium]
MKLFTSSHTFINHIERHTIFVRDHARNQLFVGEAREFFLGISWQVIHVATE